MEGRVDSHSEAKELIKQMICVIIEIKKEHQDFEDKINKLKWFIYIKRDFYMFLNILGFFLI